MGGYEGIQLHEPSLFLEPDEGNYPEEIVGLKGPLALIATPNA